MPVGYPAGAAVYWTGDAGNPGRRLHQRRELERLFLRQRRRADLRQRFSGRCHRHGLGLCRRRLGARGRERRYSLCDNIFLDTCRYSQMQNFGFGGVIGAALCWREYQVLGHFFHRPQLRSRRADTIRGCECQLEQSDLYGLRVHLANALSGGVIQLYNLTKTAASPGRRFQLSTGATIVTAGNRQDISRARSTGAAQSLAAPITTGASDI